jgi:hypothetical protein
LYGLSPYTFAIVPGEKRQWSAVIGARLRREYPDCVNRIEAIERRLRGTYGLDVRQ